MTMAEALDELARLRPALLHLNGKTSTGKSTFAATLHERWGYQLIDLDKLVRQRVIAGLGLDARMGDVFVAVYKTGEPRQWTDCFITAAADAVRAASAKGPVVIDGAIANLDILHQLYAALPPVKIVYLHPVELPVYERNLASRFMQARPDFDAHLPNTFWDLVPRSDLSQFYADHQLTEPLKTAIRNYAEYSASSSGLRLAALRQAGFEDILLIEI